MTRARFSVALATASIVLALSASCSSGSQDPATTPGGQSGSTTTTHSMGNMTPGESMPPTTHDMTSMKPGESMPGK